MDIRHQSGQEAELFVAFALAKRGRVISKPFLTQCKYDLVVEFDGEFSSIQVKRATWSRSGPHKYLQARLERGRKRLDTDVDAFAFTDCERVWVVPAEKLGGLTSVCLDCSNPDYRPYRKYEPKEWLI